MLSCQLKYIFSISLLSQTFQMDFSASPFPLFPPLILRLPTGMSSSITLLHIYLTISERSESKLFSTIFYLGLLGNHVYYRQTAIAIFYSFIFPCHQAPTETTVICFGNRPTQISFWWMATGAQLRWPVVFIWSKKVSAFKFPELYLIPSSINGIKLALCGHKAHTVNWAVKGFMLPVVGLMRQWCGCEGGWRLETEATAEKALSVSKLVCLGCVSVHG